jgi:hypothetical protein
VEGHVRVRVILGGRTRSVRRVIKQPCRPTHELVKVHDLIVRVLLSKEDDDVGSLAVQKGGVREKEGKVVRKRKWVRLSQGGAEVPTTHDKTSPASNENATLERSGLLAR